jgi:hypothetical protein
MPTAFTPALKSFADPGLLARDRVCLAIVQIDSKQLLRHAIPNGWAPVVAKPHFNRESCCSSDLTGYAVG